MNDKPTGEPRPKVERGASEEATGAPLTETEEETSKRPAGSTPGAPERTSAASGDEQERREELNPDDLE
ncbi:hypothetical protein HNP84_004163 [Thermocatellispora tengchongensis]|uniref:Uncharacterized protein n=1 Tax=Thermocatellispora tengchongensis TaxID=1073253 RepID=A0A840P9B0_9ACTN|nr:hypothetical protein [Thermocatellispora tengchongensis]MBB5134431.1 hypothetical protein [Thermocatellispora tengchongensis]